MARPVTLRMIASRLGVSVQTVSNALGQTGRVAPATAEKVQRAALEMGYVPNAGAQALRGKSTQTLAFVLCDPALTATPSAYLGFLIPLVASAIRETGFRPQIQFVEEAELEAALLPARQGLVDGVLLLANRISGAQIEALSAIRAPIVLFEREAPPGTLPFVTVDAEGGIAAAVRHVHAQGARRIAYLDGRPHFEMTTSVRRFEGFRAGMEDVGLEPVPGVEGNWQFESGVQGFEALKGRGPLPDAVVCANDQMAVGVLKAAQALGVRVPHDMMVTGFDDLEFARYTTPQLTSISLPLMEMSRSAASRLAASVLAGAKPDPAGETHPAELVIRASSRRHFLEEDGRRRTALAG